MCNGDVGKVGRLDAEVCHVDGAGGDSSDGVADDFSLYIEDFFVGCTVHGQVTSKLEMNGLPIGIG